MATVEISEDQDDNLKEKYIKLCLDLNIDVSLRDESWVGFQKIHRNVTLEGDLLHWLICSLYANCQKSSLRKDSASAEILNIPLSKTLEYGELSLLHFFKKIRKWLEMTSQHTALSEEIGQLERNFSVSSIVYEKYSAIFNNLYLEGWTETVKRSRNKKLPIVEPLTSKDIFNFCWTLYIRAKAQFPDICDDLVNSYHLLLCCLDLVVANTLSSKQLQNSINPSYPGLPKGCLEKEYSESPSMIDMLCQHHQGLVMETKIIRRQYLHAFLEDLVRRDELKGSVNKKIDILDPVNFELNFTYLNGSYEKDILKKCDIDERIFIGDNATSLIGTPIKRLTTFTNVDEKERSQVQRDLQEYFNRVKGFVPDTPLTGRRWLEEKNFSPPSQNPSITVSVSRLQELLKGLKPTPSNKLKALFQSCNVNPEESLNTKLISLSSIFLAQYTKPLDFVKNYENSDSNKEFAKVRLHLALVLFYKTLENFLVAEKRKTSADLSALLQQEVFIKCLFACCLEIVIYSYNSSRVFPWILDAFNLKPYHFFKVIELVIRSEDLSRDVIKHLSRIEEQILESLSWETDSPVYDAIKMHGIPKCQEVAGDTSQLTPLFFMSPTPIRMTKDGTNQSSPIVSLNNRFEAPAPSPAKRNLFGSPPKTESQITPTKTIMNKQTNVLFSPKTTTATTVRFPIMLAPGTSPIRVVTVSPQRGTPLCTPPRGVIRIQASPKKSNNNKKFGSFGIFFRKLYYMSSLRLQDLCGKLGIGADLHKKIWTCFEHGLLENIDMLRDRHIDQLLMCSVYVMSKVTKEEKSFHDIMKWYRTQPQASSDVYRNVLIERASDHEVISPTRILTMSPLSEENNMEDAAIQVSTDHDSATSKKANNEHGKSPEVKQEAVEKRTYGGGISKEDLHNDLIQFYNIVYIKRIKDFALKFASNKVTLDAPPISPLPVSRKQVHSPRKISKQHQIYISPIKSTVQMTPRSKMLYCFDTDSPKKLEEINAMIKGGTRRRVILDVDDNNGPSPAKRPMNGLAKRAQELRQEQLVYKAQNK